MVLMPVGWCCWLPDLRAAEQEATQEADCCCCAMQQKKGAPQKPVDPKPTPSCCCDPQPVLFEGPAVDAYLHELALPISLADPIFLAPSLAMNRSSEPSDYDPSPPFRILRCHWLC
jgi:hypothetical protein